MIDKDHLWSIVPLRRRRGSHLFFSSFFFSLLFCCWVCGAEVLGVARHLAADRLPVRARPDPETTCCNTQKERAEILSEIVARYVRNNRRKRG